MDQPYTPDLGPVIVCPFCDAPWSAAVVHNMGGWFSGCGYPTHKISPTLVREVPPLVEDCTCIWKQYSQYEDRRVQRVYGSSNNTCPVHCPAPQGDLIPIRILYSEKGSFQGYQVIPEEDRLCFPENPIWVSSEEWKMYNDSKSGMEAFTEIVRSRRKSKTLAKFKM